MRELKTERGELAPRFFFSTGRGDRAEFENATRRSLPLSFAHARAKNRTGRASYEIFFSTARGNRAEFENNAAPYLFRSRTRARAKNRTFLKLF